MSLPPQPSRAPFYSQGFGSCYENVELPVIMNRAPTGADINYPLGKRWIDSTGGGTYELVSLSSAGGTVTASWPASRSSGGAINTLTTADHTVVTPISGNINILGDANGVVTSGVAGEVDLAISNTFIAPGSIASTTTITSGTSLSSTTTITAGTGLTVTSGGETITAGGLTITAGGLTAYGNILVNDTGNSNIAIGNTGGSETAAFRAGTGGLTLDVAAGGNATLCPTQTTGTLNIGGTGNNSGTITIAGGTGTQEIDIANASGTKTVKIGSGSGPNTLTIGSLGTSSTTTIQAGSGGIVCDGNTTVTLGNFSVGSSGQHYSCKGGADTDFVGTTTLTNGVSPTIANTNIASNDLVLVSRSAVNGSTALGVFKVAISAGANFVITSCKPTDASTETGDASSVVYFIIRQV